MAALENGVSQYPKLEGRFLQVSGISFAFDPTKPSGQRVDSQFVRIGDQYIEMDTKYRLVTKSYMAAGKDGFDCLSRAKVLVSLLPVLILMFNSSCCWPNPLYSSRLNRANRANRYNDIRMTLILLNKCYQLGWWRGCDHAEHGCAESFQRSPEAGWQIQTSNQTQAKLSNIVPKVRLD